MCCLLLHRHFAKSISLFIRAVNDNKCALKRVIFDIIMASLVKMTNAERLSKVRLEYDDGTFDYIYYCSSIIVLFSDLFSYQNEKGCQ